MEFLNVVSVVVECEGYYLDVVIKNYCDVEVVIVIYVIGGFLWFDFIFVVKIDVECAVTYSSKWARENGLV